MPTPTTPLNISVKSSTSATDGEKCKITNLTKGGNLTGTLESSECVFNLANTAYDGVWEAGDTILAEISGRLQGVNSGTLASKGLSLSITTSAIAESATVSLSVNL
jgi:hypothetical protein